MDTRTGELVDPQGDVPDGRAIKEAVAEGRQLVVPPVVSIPPEVAAMPPEMRLAWLFGGPERGKDRKAANVGQKAKDKAKRRARRKSR